MGRDLEGKIVILTGAAGGIGSVVAASLVEQGAKVALLDVDERATEQLAARLGASQAFPYTCDISDWRRCASAVEATVSRFGSVQVVINNGALGMGVIRADHLRRPVTIEEVHPDCWASFMAVNLSGAFYMTRAALPWMKRQGWGRVINVTTSFFTMLRAGFYPYGPAKAGLEAWSASLASELDGSGITVNVVVPGGPADTPMHPPEAGFNRSDMIPPSAMAPPIAWLCSDNANGINMRRYIAARWSPDIDPVIAEASSGGPIAWPDLTQDPVWPGGRPAR